MMAIGSVPSGNEKKWRWYHLDSDGIALAESIDVFDSISEARSHYLAKFKTSVH